MLGLLIYDSEGYERNKDFVEYHHKIGVRYDIEFKLIIIDKNDDVTATIHDVIEKLSPKFAIVRTINPEIQKELESRDIRTYNNYKVSYYANDKARCVEYVSTYTDIDCPDTEALQKDSVISDAFIESHLGFVAKAASGHGGKEVIRISDLSVADKLNSILEKDNLVIQKFIDGPASDVRVYVVGKEIIAAVKRTAPPGDFRSNFSLGGSVDAYKLNDTEINQVNQIINLFDFGMVGIDFIIDKTGNFVFNEIEDVVGSRMLYKTHPDIDILELFISHIS